MRRHGAGGLQQDLRRPDRLHAEETQGGEAADRRPGENRRRSRSGAPAAAEGGGHPAEEEGRRTGASVTRRRPHPFDSGGL